MNTNEKDNLMEKIVSLCKRRGFIFPGSEIYGGLAGTFDWAHFGVALKNNVKNSWWKKFVDSRRDMYGIDAAILMRQEVWQATGHAEHFADPMVECEKCHKKFRTDQIEDKENCSNCSGKLGESRQFNMMFQTKVGASEDSSAVSYLRPETAQGIFVNFKNTVDAFHPKLPFGMAQIGKAFRNEITPRDFIFRQREFEQMEIEYFVREEDWEKYFKYWKDEMLEWMEENGFDMSKIFDIEIAEGDRAHYSKRTVDFEFVYPFGQKELFGLAYRSDFDLKTHKIEYIDEPARNAEGIASAGGGEKSKITPHVIEPSFGLDRAVLALLVSAYVEDSSGDEVRPYLKFKPHIAPVICAVSPLLKNKPELVSYAEDKVYATLKEKFGRVAWDDNGNIGKRYRRQDEIGTPWCIVVDFDTLEDDTVTVRDRDTAEQQRVKVADLVEYIKNKME
jgi:glycyl-tRNA synthetase